MDRDQRGAQPPLAPITTLLTFPATAALLVGLIYAVGAIARTAELTKANVATKDAFTLIPAPQYLNRGIQVLVQPRVLALPVVILLAAAYLNHLGSRTRKRLPPRRRTFLRVTTIGLWVFTAVIGPLMVAGAIIGLVAAGSMFLLSIPRGQVKRRLFGTDPPRRTVGKAVDLGPEQSGPPLPTSGVILLFAILITSVALFSEFLYPQALPVIRLDLTPQGVPSGPPAPVVGRLITFADGNWYVADKSGHITAISAQEVRAATIRPGQRGPNPFNETLFQLMY